MKKLSNLNRHKKIHNHEEKIKCKFCFKSFCSSSNLQQHLFTHENKVFQIYNLNEIPHKEIRKACLCQICGKNFVSLITLKKHFKLKHGEKYEEKYYKIPLTLPQPNLFTIKHENHVDILKNGFLYEFNVNHFCFKKIVDIG